MAITQNFSPAITTSKLSAIFAKTVANLTVADHQVLKDAMERVGVYTSSSTFSSLFTNSTGPTVTAFSLVGGPAFVTANTISFTVTFSDLVFVTGSPKVSLTIGSNVRACLYASGSGTNTLTFSYTVVSGDSADPAGSVSVTTTALALNSGTIKDQTPGNNAILTLPALSLSTITVN